MNKNKYFNTKEIALRNLEHRRKIAIKKIKKDGDKILSDQSFVYQDFLWKKDEIDFGFGKMDCVTQTNKLKWRVF